MTTIEIGAHIVTPRTGYTHHGIYVGDSLVIHYSGLSNGLSAGPIEITTLESFLSNKDLKIRKYNNPKYTGEKVVERARTRIGENNYDLQVNNCEHFCTWAVTGRSNSRQVDIAEDFMDIIVPSVTFMSLIRTRKHSKQESNATDIVKDVADIGVKTAIGMVVAAPVALPAYAAYKAIKWIFK